MTASQNGLWPNYTYIVPQIYTRARIRLVGLGNYTPKGRITNDFFAHFGYDSSLDSVGRQSPCLTATGLAC